MSAQRHKKGPERRGYCGGKPKLDDHDNPAWRIDELVEANKQFLTLLNLHHPEKAPDDYNGDLDFGASINACYDEVKKRIANGGPPWTPP